MSGLGINDVLGLVEGLLDQRQRMLVDEAVEDATALVAGRHDTTPAELRQVLGDGGRASTGELGELARRALGGTQKQDDADARGICQQGEDLGGEVDFFLLELNLSI